MKTTLLFLMATVVAVVGSLTLVHPAQAAIDREDARYIRTVLNNTFDNVSYDTAESVCESFFGYNGAEMKRYTRKRQYRFWYKKGMDKRTVKVTVNRTFKKNCVYFL